MAKDKIKEVNEELGYIEDALLSIANNLSNTIKESLEGIKDQASSVEKIIADRFTKSMKSLANSSDEILANTLKTYQGANKISDIYKLQDKLKLKELAAARSLDILLNSNVKLTKAQQKTINKSFVEAQAQIKLQEHSLKIQEEEVKLQNKKKGVTGAVVEGAGRIPILGKLIDSERVLLKIQKESSKKDSTRFSVFKEGVKGIGTSIKEKASDPAVLMGGAIGALTTIIKFFVDAMFGADERVTKLSKGLGFSKDQAAALYGNFKEAKNEIEGIYGTTKDYTEAFTELIELSEFNNIANREMVETQILLTKNLGLSKEEAFGVQDAFAASNLEAEKGKDIVYDQIASFANQNKLLTTGKKVFTDIAKTSKLIQINFKDNFGSLVKTTLEAKKLGLSLDQVSKIGDSLLNFESSIAAELEAELLTSQDLNLEEARRLALNHDIAGLTQEISKQGITQEYFAGLNVIQQESIAKALGMSSTEMGDMLYKQKIIAKYGGDTIKNLKKEIELAHNRGDLQGEMRLQAKYDAIEQGILSGKSADEADRATTAQEKFNKSLDAAKELFSDFVDGGSLDALADALFNVADVLTGGEASAKKAESINKKIIEAKKNNDTNLVKELQAKQSQAFNQADENDSTAKTIGAVKYGIVGATIMGLIGAGLTATGVGAPIGLPMMVAGAVGAGVGYIGSGEPGFAKGGIVPPGYPNDTYRARLSSGEAVVSVDKLYASLDKQTELLSIISRKSNDLVVDGDRLRNNIGMGFAIG